MRETCEILTSSSEVTSHILLASTMSISLCFLCQLLDSTSQPEHRLTKSGIFSVWSLNGPSVMTLSWTFVANIAPEPTPIHTFMPEYSSHPLPHKDLQGFHSSGLKTQNIPTGKAVLRHLKSIIHTCFIFTLKTNLYSPHVDRLIACLIDQLLIQPPI